MAPGKRDHDSQRLRGEVLMGKNVQSLLALAVAIVVWSAPPAFADKRVALVIGNGAYKNAVHLPNPRNDAQDVAASLARTGFETSSASIWTRPGWMSTQSNSHGWRATPML